MVTRRHRLGLTLILLVCFCLSCFALFFRPVMPVIPVIPGLNHWSFYGHARTSLRTASTAGRASNKAAAGRLRVASFGWPASGPWAVASPTALTRPDQALVKPLSRSLQDPVRTCKDMNAPERGHDKVMFSHPFVGDLLVSAEARPAR